MSSSEASSKSISANVRGNLAPQHKETIVKRFGPFFDGFISDIGHRIQLIEANVHKPGDEQPFAWADATFELEVTSNMCNFFDMVHGGCTTFLLDMCCFITHWALAFTNGSDHVGPTLNMNISWHGAAVLGQTLVIKCKTGRIKGRLHTAHGEVRDKATNKLFTAAEHTSYDTIEKFAKKIEQFEKPKL